MENSIQVKEFIDDATRNLCFTSRQIKGLEKLDDAIMHCREKGLRKNAQELSQIKHVIESSIIKLKLQKYKNLLLETKPFI